MPGAARAKVDAAGGTVLEGSEDVLINNQPAARKGDAVQGHPPGGPHSPPQPVRIVEGSSTVMVNNKPLAFKGAQASCGHTLTGSDDVIVGV